MYSIDDKSRFLETYKSAIYIHVSNIRFIRHEKSPCQFHSPLGFSLPLCAGRFRLYSP